MTLASLTGQQLGEVFGATSDIAQGPTRGRAYTSPNPRQLKRWKEKQVKRWFRQMGAMPALSPVLETNIPNRIGQNLLDEDGNLNLGATKSMGAKGGAIAAMRRRSALEARIRQVLEDPIIARNWGNQKMKGFIARRAGVKPKTVGTWFKRFPARLILK